MKQSEKKCYVEFSTGVSSICPVNHAPVCPFYSELQSMWQRHNPSVTEKPNPHPTVLMEGLYLLSPTGKLCHIPSHCEANLWFMGQRISLQPQQLLSKISLTNHTRSYLKQLTEFSQHISCLLPGIEKRKASTCMGVLGWRLPWGLLELIGYPYLGMTELL